jgi:hypothetical protein
MKVDSSLRGPASLLRALRAWTPLGFFALIAVLVWSTSMVGLQRGDGRGLLAFLLGFGWVAVITLLAYRLVRQPGKAPAGAGLVPPAPIPHLSDEEPPAHTAPAARASRRHERAPR